MTKDDQNEQALGPIKGLSLLASDTKQWFHRRSDLTYRKIEDVSISKADAFQSLFTGSLIRNSRFEEVIFARSDLDGIRAEGCEFLDCDFSVCDIRSSHFVKCVFRNCKLSECYVDACEFIACSLVGCSFQSSSVTNSVFSSTKLKECGLSRSTNLHDRFYDCAIEDMTLGDCTFLYAIFRSCVLVRVTLNAESVGGILGLGKEQVSECPSIYLGEIQNNSVAPTDDIVQLFVAEYQKRRWYLGELVLHLNFQSISVVEAFKRYFANTSGRVAEMGFVKAEELEFIAEIIEELASQRRLPLVTVMSTLEWCSNVEKSLAARPGDSQKHANATRLLATRTTFVANALLDVLGQAVERFSLKSDKRMALRATFETKPSIPLVEIVNSLAAQSGLNTVGRTTFLRAEQGSYVEWVWTTLFSALAFQVFLFLINGCVIQLTELKHRAKLWARSKSVPSYLELALKPVQHASPVVMGVVQQLTSFTKSLPLLTSPDLSGFSRTNVKSLEVVEDTNSSETKSIKRTRVIKPGSRAKSQ